MDIAANLDSTAIAPWPLGRTISGSMVSAEADHHLSAPTVAQLAAQTRKC